ncbi:hypothetical protein D3C84_1149860 [compost metagenome]
MIVEDGDLHRDVVNGTNRKLLRAHLEAAIPVDRNNEPIRISDLCADSGGEAEAHRAKAAGCNERAGVHEFVKLPGPHLVLPNVGRHNGFALGRLVH